MSNIDISDIMPVAVNVLSCLLSLCQGSRMMVGRLAAWPKHHKRMQASYDQAIQWVFLGLAMLVLLFLCHWSYHLLLPFLGARASLVHKVYGTVGGTGKAVHSLHFSFRVIINLQSLHLGNNFLGPLDLHQN